MGMSPSPVADRRPGALGGSQTGTVEPEAVQAVIDDGVKPLIALDSQDGSTIGPRRIPFLGGKGTGSPGVGWLEAGQIRPGDRLRTAAGTEVIVIRVRWNVGEAEVYTLTVATDHTFFVGSAHVLVHNPMLAAKPWSSVRATSASHGALWIPDKSIRASCLPHRTIASVH